ncbi:tellurite resistance TerB family protein [Microbulbifer sp. SAOS-129_SWC]|uniref:tellurite resistance TerB family protein n=1 Tax=Microbulbifer sp. SAOS-129_SWC TaxID=3145235 RepID=UPI0032164BC6
MNKKLLLGALIGAGMSMLNKKMRQQPQRAPAPDLSRVPPPQAGPGNESLDDIFARAGRDVGGAPGQPSHSGGSIGAMPGSVGPGGAARGAVPGGMSGGIPGGAMAGGAGALIEIARRIFAQVQQQQPRGAGGRPAAAGGGPGVEDIFAQIFGRTGGKFGRSAGTAAPAQLFGFADAGSGAHGEEQADVMLRGMIAAAQADGRIDEAEQRNIAKALEGQLDSADLDEFRQLLTTPVDMDQVIARVHDPATALNLYLVSAMTINEDNPRETRYLAQLAEKLGISEEALHTIEHELPHAA